MILFWVLTWINLKGVQTSAKLNNIFAIAGMAVPMLLLILLGAIWIKVGHPQQIDFKIVPPLTQSTNWVSLIAIMASFLGIELSSVHVNDIHRPQKNFPKAILTACIAIVLSMGLGALSIAMVLPKKEIYLVSGIMQVFAHLFDVFGLNILTPILTLLIVMGSLGTMINWVISPAKGLLNAAESGLLPVFFSRKNRAGVASNILLAQALLVSIFCLLFLLEPNVNGSFWFLTALSTELYMMMYLLMFSAVLWLRASSKDSTSFKIPGGAFGLWTTCCLGLIGCVSTIIISFFPPENIHIGHPVKYLVTICAGNLITISPLFIFYFAARQKTKRGLSRVELE